MAHVPDGCAQGQQMSPQHMMAADGTADDDDIGEDEGSGAAYTAFVEYE